MSGKLLKPTTDVCIADESRGMCLDHSPADFGSNGVLAEALPAGGDVKAQRAQLAANGGAAALEAAYTQADPQAKAAHKESVEAVMPWRRSLDRKPSTYTAGGTSYRRLGGNSPEFQAGYEGGRPGVDLGSFRGGTGEQISVLNDKQCQPMTAEEARYLAMEQGHATSYDGRTTEQLQVRADAPDGFAVNRRHNETESAERVGANNPRMSDRMSGIIAEINQDRNEHVPTMMAESGQSSEVVVGCSSAARSTDALWAGSQAAGIMTAYLPPVTKGVTGPAARAGSEAGMLGTQLVKTQAPTAAKMAADAIPGAIDAAQGFLGADADGPTMGLSGFATAEQVTATMPKGEYERCLDRYGYE